MKTPQNSRGIAITALFRRFFEKMLLKTTEHTNQAGFIKKVKSHAIIR
jgi:hypothetical protein